MATTVRPGGLCSEDLGEVEFLKRRPGPLKLSLGGGVEEPEMRGSVSSSGEENVLVSESLD